MAELKLGMVLFASARIKNAKISAALGVAYYSVYPS